jgi:signal transduction histidine kinase
MSLERLEPVVLEPPVPRGHERLYPWLGVFLGAAGGFFIVHPLTMAVYELYMAFSYGMPLQLGRALLISFYPYMWPMTLLYTVLSLLVGWAIGIFLKRLKEHQQQLQTFHQEFELQVAALRHHYKNLAIGIKGFSSRLKRKLAEFDAELHQCGLVEVSACQNLHEECQALIRNADILEGTAQRLTGTLNQEVRFLKALTSDVLDPEPQDIYPFLIGAIQDLLDLRFRDKNIRVEINGRPPAECRDSLVFAFEPNAMEVILQNLLSNAMKYGDHIRVEVAEKESWVRIIIKDNGPGLEVGRLQSRLLAPPDREETASTHLGLRVSLHLIFKTRARLAVSSEPGAGAAFIVDFPRQ